VREGSIRGLRAFCAAARHLSFKTAAEELSVTPSAVSHRIKALEERLQGALFERRARDLTLTPLGVELLAHIEPLLCELDNVTERFEQRAGRRRVLRIAVTPFFASELLVPRLDDFAQRHRAIDIYVETAVAAAQHSASCDAAILLLPAPPADAIAQPLFALRFAPACSPRLAKEHALADPAALLGATLIVHERRQNVWREWFLRMNVTVERRPKTLYLDSWFAIARAAERGLGVALMPLALSHGWFASGALVRPCGGELETSERYFFCQRPDTAGNPDVAAFRDWITAAFAVEGQPVRAAPTAA
jgi:LysR family glycine cleavage system transcriptional activator